MRVAMPRAASRAGDGRGAKRETALVSTNDLDARHSDDEVFLLVGLRRYDAISFCSSSDVRAASGSVHLRSYVTLAHSHTYTSNCFAFSPRIFQEERLLAVYSTLRYFTVSYPTLPFPNHFPPTPPYHALPSPRHLHLTLPYPTLSASILPCPTLS